MHDFYISLDGEDYIVRVKSFTPADSGKLSGPPEDCYPPSGADADFELLDEQTGSFADECVACKHYNTIMDEIKEQAAGMADDEGW